MRRKLSLAVLAVLFCRFKGGCEIGKLGDNTHALVSTKEPQIALPSVTALWFEIHLHVYTYQSFVAPSQPRNRAGEPSQLNSGLLR